MIRKLVTGALGVAALSFGSVVHAEALDFCVDASTYGNASGAEALNSCVGVTNPAATGFTADVLFGSYQEKVLATQLDADAGLEFKSTTVFNFSSFRYDEGSSTYDAGDTGLGVSYRLYALIFATGQVSGGGGTFNADGATLEVWLDPQRDTPLGINSITDGTLAFNSSQANDVKLAFGSDLDFGLGSLPSLNSDGFAVQFRDFTLTTPGGETFFIAPWPFHFIVYSDGSILDTTVGPPLLTAEGQQISLNGTGDASFRIPEPGSLALVGLSLLGVAAVRRRKA
jgi:hypothetical protein